MPATAEKKETRQDTTFDRKALHNLLSLLARGLPRTPIRPEWGCVEVDIVAGHLAAHCGDFRAQLHIPPTAVKGGGWSEGRVCVEAGRLVRLLGNMPHEEVTFSIRGSRPAHMLVRAEGVVYKLANLDIPRLPAVSPPAEPGQSVEVSASALAEAIKIAHPAADQTAGRYSLHGLHLRSTEDRLLVEATDGRRLHRAVCDLEPPNASFSALLPACTTPVVLGALAHIDPEPVILHVPKKGGLQLRDHDNSCIFEFPLIDGKFPKTDDIIDCHEDYLEFTIDSTAVRSTLDRILCVDSGEVRVAQLELTTDPDNGNVQLQIACSAGHEQIPVQLLNDEPYEPVRIDCRYLRDVVKVVQGDVTLAVHGPENALRIYHEAQSPKPNLVAVIMPLASTEDEPQ